MAAAWNSDTGRQHSTRVWRQWCEPPVVVLEHEQFARNHASSTVTKSEQRIIWRSANMYVMRISCFLPPTGRIFCSSVL